MAKAKLTKDQREARKLKERERRAALKNDEGKYHEYLEKERKRKKAAVACGKIKCRVNMSRRELLLARKKTKQRVENWRRKHHQINPSEATERNDHHQHDPPSVETIREEFRMSPAIEEVVTSPIDVNSVIEHEVLVSDKKNPQRKRKAPCRFDDENTPPRKPRRSIETTTAQLQGNRFFDCTPQRQPLQGISTNVINRSKRRIEYDYDNHQCASSTATIHNGPVIRSKSRQQIAGDKLRAKNKKAVQKIQEDCMAQILTLKRKLWRTQKREWRKKRNISIENLSPRSQTFRITKGQLVSKQVIKNLREGCAIKAQLRERFKSVGSRKQKHVVQKFLAGKILKSERILKSVSLALSVKLKVKPKAVCKDFPFKEKKSVRTEKIVHDFMLSKLASVECPGKRQGKSYSGVQRQRRYMTADLRALYKQFMASRPQDTPYISYRTFCRYKPKWVITPKINSRDTCLCKVCENMKLLFKSCKSLGLVCDISLRDLTNSLCCEPARDDCLLRTCDECKNKVINFLECADSKPAMYCKWTSCREEAYSFKLKDFISITVLKKCPQYVTVKELRQLLASDHLLYMQHIGRVVNQTKALDSKIESLDESEMLLLIDWSMNYVCKFGREPQSVHFGASHKQLAFHTGRLYTTDGVEQSVLTISEITRHDPCAIIAHVIPVLTKYLQRYPLVTKLYFASDGPVNQYRNRDMYFLLIHFIVKLFPLIKFVVWIFSEAGHGKNEADGVGGQSKRECDKAVAHGNDLDAIEKVQEVISQRCPSIDVSIITLDQILAVDSILLPKTSPVEGTMKMHHYTWRKENPNQIIFKTLSCRHCPTDHHCPHFLLGKPWSLEPPPSKSKSRSKSKKIKVSAPPQKPATSSVPVQSEPKAKKQTNTKRKKTGELSLEPETSFPLPSEPKAKKQTNTKRKKTGELSLEPETSFPLPSEPKAKKQTNTKRKKTGELSLEPETSFPLPSEPKAKKQTNTKRKKTGELSLEPETSFPLPSEPKAKKQTNTKRKKTGERSLDPATEVKNRKRKSY